MAYTPRSWQTIYAQIIASKQAQSSLNGLTSTSQAAYWNLWAFIVSVSQNLLEQIWAILVASIEATVSGAVPGTIPWIQSQVLLFQDGNVIQINPNFTYGYPSPSFPTPITSCAVQVTPAGAIQIKVAKAGPSPLSSGQQTELYAYMTAILPSGQYPIIISVAADILQVNAVVYYNGQFNSTIQAAVQAALTSYMTLLPFNGVVKISSIEETILNVPGVVDVTIIQITATPTGGAPVNLVLASATLQRLYQTYAGYMVNDPANLFSSTITYQVAAQ